jgi:hypothetical protein
MDDDVRDLLSRYLPPAEPPLPLPDLAAGRRARRRNHATRVVGALTAVAVLGVGVVLVASARGPDSRTPAASAGPETPAHVFARLDATWRTLIPGGGALLHDKDSNDSTPPETTFSGSYRLPAPASRTQANYSVTRNGGPAACPAPDNADYRCSLQRRPDGSTLLLEEASYPDNHLVLRGVNHYRTDGVTVSAGVFVPGQHRAGAQFPYTTAQLTTAATDPRMTFGPNVRIPASAPSPSPSHTPPAPNPTVPAADLPRLDPQPDCRDRPLDSALGTAVSQTLATKVGELVGPDQVEPDGGSAEQGCIKVGAFRQAFGAVAGKLVNFGVDVQVTTYASAPPTTKDAACTPDPISCDLSRLPDGRTVAQYELNTGANDNLHVDIWYSPYVTVQLTALPADGAADHAYGLDRAEWVAIVTDPHLIDIARRLPTS